MENSKKIIVPARYNYIACFLTLNCNLRCDYCINYYGGSKADGHIISAEKWSKALNRLECNDGLPVTLQGGEPSLHPEFINIIKSIKECINIDILTNLTFDIQEFIREVNPSRLKRKALYPSIRVSYHPERADLDRIICNVLIMQEAGFSIGVFGVLHPRFSEKILTAQERCRDLGIDFRVKEFLGEFNGRIYGTYFYQDSVCSKKLRKCLCRTSELIVGPDGGVYKCHSDLYNNYSPIGNLLHPDFKIEDIFRNCDRFGDCNPCDVKIKTNRFQVYGHTSVEIKNIR